MISGDYVKAISPTFSAYVSSSAGTGKTKILTDRILNLLLSGVPTHRILCITFTNTAANEMQTRIVEKLENWSKCTDLDLHRDLETMMPKSNVNQASIRAKNLIDIYSQKPIRIQTIHSFCRATLQNFPIEAGVKIDFTILTNTAEATRYIYNKLVEDFSQKSDPMRGIIDPLAQISGSYDSFENIGANFVNHNLYQIVEAIIHNRHLIDQEKILETADNFSAIKIEPLIYQNSLELCRALENFFTNCNDQEFLDQLPDFHVLRNKIEQINLSASSKHQFDYLQAIELCQLVKPLEAIFLTKARTKRKKIKGLSSSSALFESIDQVQDTLLANIQNQNLANFLRNNTRLAVLTSKVFVHYKAYKNARNLLDYHDLIIYTFNLLNVNPLKDWILYKIDHAIDHLLIDEAQDTSTEQWNIIHALISAANTIEEHKTIFIVGDDKQSIYSFQGSHAMDFINYKEQIREIFKQNRKNLILLDLHTNYRSSFNIINVANTFFEHLRQTNNELALPQRFNMLPHKSSKGFVEVWHNKSISSKQPGRFEQTLDLASDKVQDIKQARKIDNAPSDSEFALDEQTLSSNCITSDLDNVISIANFIKDSVERGLYLNSVGRAAQPQDFMVLTRTRDANFFAINKHLADLGLKPYVTDRVLLQDLPKIKQLIWMAKFILAPHKDFNLVVVLSNVFQVKQELLAQIQTQKDNHTSLLQYILQQQRFSHIAMRLQQCLAFREICDTKNFFLKLLDLLNIIQPKQTSNNSLNSLEAYGIDNLICLIEEFVALRINPSVEEFLSYLDSTEFAFRSPIDSTGVILSTVHGVKGMEAPVVIFIDHGNITKQHGPLVVHKGQPFFNYANAYDFEYMQDIKKEIKQKSYEEYLRLFYVALTRAKDGFIVITPSSNPSVNSCYAMLNNFLLESHIELGSKQNQGSQLLYEDLDISGIGYGSNEKQYNMPKPSALDSLGQNNFAYNSNIMPIIAPEIVSCTPTFSEQIKPSNLKIEGAKKLGVMLHTIMEDIIADIDSIIKTGTFLHPLMSSLPIDIRTKLYKTIPLIFKSKLFRRIKSMQILPEIEIGGRDNNGIDFVQRIDLLALQYNNRCKQTQRTSCDTGLDAPQIIPAANNAIIVDYKMQYDPVYQASYQEQLNEYVKHVELMLGTISVAPYIVSLLDAKIYPIRSE